MPGERCLGSHTRLEPQVLAVVAASWGPFLAVWAPAQELLGMAAGSPHSQHMIPEGKSQVEVQ